MNKHFLVIVFISCATPNLSTKENISHKEEVEIEEEIDDKIELEEEIDDQDEDFDFEKKYESNESYDVMKIKELNSAQVDLHNKIKNLEETMQEQPSNSNNSFAKSIATFVSLIATYHFYLKDSEYFKKATLEKAENVINENEAKENGYDKKIQDLENIINDIQNSISNYTILQATLNRLKKEVETLRLDVTNTKCTAESNTIVVDSQKDKINEIEKALDELVKKNTQNHSNYSSPQATSTNISPMGITLQPRSPEKPIQQQSGTIKNVINSFSGRYQGSY